MIFEVLDNGSCRSYILGNVGVPDVVIIDPHMDFVPQYLEYLEKNKRRLTHVFDTHTHADHVSGAVVLQNETGCVYMMHKSSPVEPVSEHIEDGFSMNIGDVELSVLYTPGHSKDSISIILPDKILTGDALFLDEGGAGRDDLYGGDPDEHWESFQRVGGLSDDLLVYPGHDYRGRKPSTIGEQKVHNPYLRYKSKASYVSFSRELKFGIVPWMDDVVKTNIQGATEPVDIIPESTTGNTCEAQTQNPCEPAGAKDPSLPDSIHMITTPELQNKMTDDHELVLLDVREADELEADLGHLEGIVHIPVGEVLTRLSELEQYKNREVISICKVGGRAKTAALLLAGAGFSDIAILEGGMTAYRKYENENHLS